MLLSLLTLPLIGVILMFNSGSLLKNKLINGEDSDKKVIFSKNMTLIITSLNLFLSLLIFGLFNFSSSELQFVEEYYNINNFDIYLGVDGLSIYFIVRPAEWKGKSLEWWGKLSNSGDPLKFLMPSGNHKVTCGWTNHSCMVISQKITSIFQKTQETVIGNRGSKSAVFLIIVNKVRSIAVKEQRVNGSWHVSACLRYTLTDFKRNFHIKILSKQIQLSTLILPLYRSFYKFTYNKSLSGFAPNRRFITSLHRRSLDPWFISEFTDAEGSFIIQVRKLPINRTGLRIEARFKITIYKKDLTVLEKLQAYFKGVGKIGKSGENTLSYEIRSLEEINSVVLPHFETDYLISSAAEKRKQILNCLNKLLRKWKEGNI